MGVVHVVAGAVGLGAILTGRLQAQREAGDDAALCRAMVAQPAAHAGGSAAAAAPGAKGVTRAVTRAAARGEYVRGVDGDIHRRGYYGLAAWNVTPTLEVVHRVEVFDPDVRRAATAADEGATELLGGVNLYPAGHNAKLQLNAVNRRWAHHAFTSVRQLLLHVPTSW